jgi:Zn-dependent metalloprotease
MCKKRMAINCIVPPHMLEEMLKSDDNKVRDSALRTLTASARIRGEREIIGPLRTAMLTNSFGKKHRSIYDAQHQRLPPSKLPGLLVRDEGDPPNADASVNRAYDGLGKTFDFYDEVLDRNSIDGHGMRLVATVHYDDGFNNAFWNGKQMVFGDGDGIIFKDFTLSLDVIAHELAHGVTEQTAGLEYHNQSGALNESFSDVFGSLVEQYSARQRVDEADWLIGNEIIVPAPTRKALRSMKEPGTAYRNDPILGNDIQPKHMSKFRVLPDTEFGDFGGVHINSGIPNHAFFLVARTLGGNAWEDAGQIWYQTLQQLFPEAVFQDCADISAQVASQRYGEHSRQHDAVVDAWQKVGVPVSSPDSAAAKSRVQVGKNGKHMAELKYELESLTERLGVVVKQISV